MTENPEDEQFYRGTEAIAFPKIDDRQLALLEPLGRRCTLRCGEILSKAGQRDLGMTVVLSGELEAFEARDGHQQILACPGPRDFVGDKPCAITSFPFWRQIFDSLSGLVT